MDAGVIIAIVVGALILLALFVVLGKTGSERRKETRREEARERAAEAEEQHRDARDRHIHAASVDPDVDEREAAERFDRERR